MNSVVISSHLPDVVDAYIAMRAQRLQADRQAADLKEREEVLKDHLITSFRSQGMSALGGGAGVVKMGQTDEPEALNWDELYAYIKANDAWELLHKRVGSTAVKERWKDGVEVPGVGHKTVYKLTVSGAKS